MQVYLCTVSALAIILLSLLTNIGMLEWGDWSKCSAHCDGLQIRKQVCEQGRMCNGSMSQRRPCSKPCAAAQSQGGRHFAALLSGDTSLVYDPEGQKLSMLHVSFRIKPTETSGVLMHRYPQGCKAPCHLEIVIELNGDFVVATIATGQETTNVMIRNVEFRDIEEKWTDITLLVTRSFIQLQVDDKMEHKSFAYDLGFDLDQTMIIGNKLEGSNVAQVTAGYSGLLLYTRINFAEYSIFPARQLGPRKPMVVNKAPGEFDPPEHETFLQFFKGTHYQRIPAVESVNGRLSIFFIYKEYRRGGTLLYIKGGDHIIMLKFLTLDGGNTSTLVACAQQAANGHINCRLLENVLSSEWIPVNVTIIPGSVLTLVDKQIIDTPLTSDDLPKVWPYIYFGGLPGPIHAATGMTGYVRNLRVDKLAVNIEKLAAFGKAGYYSKYPTTIAESVETQLLHKNAILELQCPDPNGIWLFNDIRVEEEQFTREIKQTADSTILRISPDVNKPMASDGFYTCLIVRDLETVNIKTVMVNVVLMSFSTINDHCSAIDPFFGTVIGIAILASHVN